MVVRVVAWRLRVVVSRAVVVVVVLEEVDGWWMLYELYSIALFSLRHHRR